MIEMEGLELISFQMIAASGAARSYYIEAIQYAKQKDFQKAKECMKEADNEYIEAHRLHASLLQKEAIGEKSEFQILFIHALDQMMSAETFGILAKEFIEIYQKIID